MLSSAGYNHREQTHMCCNYNQNSGCYHQQVTIIENRLTCAVTTIKIVDAIIRAGYNHREQTHMCCNYNQNSGCYHQQVTIIENRLTCAVTTIKIVDVIISRLQS